MEQRRHHLSLPVKVGQKLEPELTLERLRELDGVGGLVLISGEGGVGKTSLALRIAGWALEGRLTERAVVPVLVEADLQAEESLLSRVRSTLLTLTEHRGSEGTALAPTLPLVQALLERRRLPPAAANRSRQRRSATERRSEPSNHQIQIWVSSRTFTATP